MIIGAGGLGLMCIAIHKAMGGKSAIVVDIDPAKREAAKQAGAELVIDGNAPDAAQQIVDATKGGAWAVIDLVGSSATARLGLDSLIKGGKYIIVGLYGGDITMSLPPFPMRAITIQGSYVGSLPEMRELIELVRRTGLPPVPVATRPLDDVNAVLNDLRAGKIVGRVVLTPNARPALVNLSKRTDPGQPIRDEQWTPTNFAPCRRRSRTATSPIPARR